MKPDFDQFATDYRQTHTGNIKKIAGVDSYYFAKQKVVELQRFEINSERDVLDLGCGDGATALYMSELFPAFSIKGIDVSGESIVVAQRRAVLNAHFSQYDGNKIPYSENSFDIVFIAGVLHHVKEEKQFALLAEIARVLKPGGRLYLFEHNPYNPFTKYLVNTCVFDKGVKLLSSSKSQGLIRRSGLEIKDKRYTIFFPRGRFFKWLHKLEPMLSNIPIGGQYYFRAIKKANQH